MDTDIAAYGPITSYGVVGNCRSVALIAPDGRVDWGCFPDFDSPAIFCRLLDSKRGGYFQIAPFDSSIPGTQRYLRGSNVLQTTFSQSTGEVVLTDLMPVETQHSWHGNFQTDTSSRCLIRSVECTKGEMIISMALKVTPHYATVESHIALLPDQTGAIISGGDQHIGLSIVGAACVPSFSLRMLHDLHDGQPVLVAQASLLEGNQLIFTLGMGPSTRAVYSLVEQDWPRRSFEEEVSQTLHYWRRWVAKCTYHGPYADIVQRSALTLKMLTYAPTGALVAAPTTSLPEVPGGERNWDYRYTWLRDATFTLYALNLLGFTEETRAFLHWLGHFAYACADGLQVMYGIRREHDLTERELSHLSGYLDSRPVRIGNRAALQKQHDIFGEVLDCIHFYQRMGGFEADEEQLEGPLWEMMQSLIEHVCSHWQEPDSGIWEVRNEPAHFVYSKVMCWVALDRGIRAAERFELRADLLRWRLIRDEIHSHILTHGYDAQLGAFTQSYGSKTLDASNLLMPLVGFISPTDPRMLSTVECIMQYLMDEEGFVYRYHADDGLTGSEGTFAICTLWLVDNLAMQGRLTEATQLFERVLTYAGPLGLFSEEIDTTRKVALGNYPQAFTHLAVISSALNLQKAAMRQANLPSREPDLSANISI